MKRLNSKPKDKRVHRCLQCEKSRMVRDLDHTISIDKQEYKTRDGTTIELFIDICEFCKSRNWTRYFEPSKADVRRIIKTMHEESGLDEDQTLEDLL